MWLLNPTALFIALISFIVSFLFYRSVADRKERCLSYGSMTQTITLLIGFGMPLYYLSKLNDAEVLGKNIETNLTVIVLGVSINFICKIVARVKYSG